MAGGKFQENNKSLESCSNGLFQKKSAPPRRMESFFNPPSHLDFLKHKIPPPDSLDFQDKRPPLPPGFPGKNIRLKFNLLLIENRHNHAQKMFVFLEQPISALSDIWADDEE